MQPQRLSLPYLAVQLYGQDVAGIAVVADLCAFLEVIDVHLPWFCVADHHHQAAREEALHDVDIGDFICRESGSQVTRMVTAGDLVTGAAHELTFMAAPTTHFPPGSLRHLSG